MSWTYAAFTRKRKIYSYVGHAGHCSVVSGYQDECEVLWKGQSLTKNHKSKNTDERVRSMQSGGKMVRNAGIRRVVWNRPCIGPGYWSPVRKSTDTNEGPFSTISWSLCDLWHCKIKPFCGVSRTRCLSQSSASWMYLLPYLWSTWSVECPQPRCYSGGCAGSGMARQGASYAVAQYCAVASMGQSM